MFSAIELMPFPLALAGLVFQISLARMFLVVGGMVLLVTMVAAGQRVVREID
jgi:hypothetical protein